MAHATMLGHPAAVGFVNDSAVRSLVPHQQRTCVAASCSVHVSSGRGFFGASVSRPTSRDASKVVSGRRRDLSARAAGKPMGIRLRPDGGPGGRGGYKDPAGDDGVLVNEAIRCPEVRLLDEEQKMVGVVDLDTALGMAKDAELDLVMISPEASPPVVRIVDYSKFRYEQQKRKRDQQKKAAANRQELKELKMRYNIDSHDYDVRLRACQRFLRDGDKVKVSLQFKGREMDFRDLAIKLFERFVVALGEETIVESKAAMEGRNLVMILSPSKATMAKAKSKGEKPERKGKAGAALGLSKDDGLGLDFDLIEEGADYMSDADVDVDVDTVAVAVDEGDVDTGAVAVVVDQGVVGTVTGDEGHTPTPR